MRRKARVTVIVVTSLACNFTQNSARKFKGKVPQAFWGFKAEKNNPNNANGGICDITLFQKTTLEIAPDQGNKTLKLFTCPHTAIRCKTNPIKMPNKFGTNRARMFYKHLLYVGTNLDHFLLTLFVT